MNRFADTQQSQNERLDSVQRRLDRIHNYLIGQPCPPSEKIGTQEVYPTPEGALLRLDDTQQWERRHLERIFDQLDALDRALEVPNEGPSRTVS